MSFDTLFLYGSIKEKSTMKTKDKIENEKTEKQNKRIARIIRIIRTVKQIIGYIVMFAGPLIAAIFVAMIWKKYLYNIILTVDPVRTGDGNILIMGFAAIFAIGYFIFAERTVETVWSQYEEIRYHLITDEKKEFLAKKDKRIKGIIHLELGILSIFILALIMIIRYENLLFGQMMIGLWVYLITMWLFIAYELDDPFSGFWTIEIADPWYKKMSKIKIRTHEELYKFLNEAIDGKPKISTA